MKYAIFNDVRATEIQYKVKTWDRMIEDELINAPPSEKAKAHLIKLAEFSGEKNKHGCLRTDEFMTAITGIECDYDAGAIRPEEAAARLQMYGIKSVVVTTHSHTPTKPRWRVLAPTSRHLDPSERTALVERVNTAMSGTLSGESFTASQAFYVGRPVDGEYLVLQVEGKCIDLMTEIPRTTKRATVHSIYENGFNVDEFDGAEPEPAHTYTTNTELIRRITSGELVHDSLLVLQMRYVKQGMNDADIANEMQDLELQIAQSRGADRAAEFRTEWRRALRGAREKITPARPIQKDKLVIDLVKPTGFKPSPTIIKNVLPEDGICTIWGAPGTYKSFIVLDMALCVAHGIPWHGNPSKQGRVWLISGEGQGGMANRVEAWHKLREMDWYEDGVFKYTPRGLILSEDGKTTEGTQALLDLIEGGNTPQLVVVDTLARSMTGDENSSQDISAYIRAISLIVEAVKEAGGHCCIVLIHHSRKDGTTYRGSNALQGALDYEYSTTKEDGAVTFTCHRVKDGREIDPMRFVMQSVIISEDYDDHGEFVKTTSLVPVQDLTSLDELAEQKMQADYDKIREAIESGHGGSLTKLKNSLGIKGKSTESVAFIDTLVAHGLITKTKTGQTHAYTVTDPSKISVTGF